MLAFLALLLACAVSEAQPLLVNATTAPSPPSGPPSNKSFVKVGGTRFVIDNVPFYFIGANLPLAMTQASLGPAGKADLISNLDSLAAAGITQLRVLGGSEGPDSGALQPIYATGWC